MTFDEYMKLVGLAGAIILFAWGLYQWRDGQQWKRADKLDGFITDFDSNELLVLGRMILDWTRREVTYKERTVTISNTDVILALRLHSNLPQDNTDDTVGKYTGEQPLIRDALDALLGFFDRLYIAIDTGLIDKNHARSFFRYWVERLVYLDSHALEKETQTTVGAQGTLPARIAAYVGEYGNIAMTDGLCTYLDVERPKEWRDEVKLRG